MNASPDILDPATLAAPAWDGPCPGYRFGDGEAADTDLRRRRKQAWRSLAGPMVVPWRRGLRLELHPRNETCEVVFLTGRYEPNETHWLETTLRPGMVFVDVGANLGMFALLAAACVGPAGRVVAVEPSSRERGRLLANVKLNGFGNTTVLAAATGETAGKALLHVAREPNTGHNTLGAFIYDVREELAETVEVHPLDDLLAPLNLARLDVMKMDIEGAEARTLRGAATTIERFHPTLLIEVNDRSLANQGSQSREIWDFLKSRGYDFRGFDPATGLLTPATRRDAYPDSENLVAVHASRSQPR